MMQRHKRRRNYLLPSIIDIILSQDIIVILLLIRNVVANTNHNFCGSTWTDASLNCKERHHCPNASDEECMPGQICFADTSCDINKGHGNNAPPLPASQSSTGVNGLTYGDRANTRFCQSQTTTQCTVDLWCGDGSSCPDDMICNYAECHYQDLIKIQEEEEKLNEISTQQQLLIGAGPNDPIRNNFCGKTWDDASAKCGVWCLDGDRTTCPGDETCFADTTCYSDMGLVPTPSPTTPYPTTRPPTVREDPSNFRYCGTQWASTECTIEGHCPTGTECKGGQTCFTIQRCNVQDLDHPPTTTPTVSPTVPFDHPKYFTFCGKTYEHAASICSLDTRCVSDDNCLSGSKCFEGLPEHCNAFFMEHPELTPTARPTDPTGAPTTAAPVTKSPTVREDPRNMRFCGASFGTTKCSFETHCPDGNECKDGETCFTIPRCNVHDMTLSPTLEPTSSPILPRDHISYGKFCGSTVTDAVIHCSLETHCWDDTSCSSGKFCLDTPLARCNAFDMLYPDLVPTARPTDPTSTPTTAAPVTEAPIVRNDPLSVRFCGKSWNTVVCSKESHCPIGNECPEGELCFTAEHCNIHDYTDEPTPNPTPLPTSTSKFCGRNVVEAIENCGLETHCTSDESCPVGQLCFPNLPEKCMQVSAPSADSSVMTSTPTPLVLPSRTRRPTIPTPPPTYLPPTSLPTPQLASRTLRPTAQPSKRTVQPTTSDPTTKPDIEDWWCGKTQSDANQNCREHTFWCGVSASSVITCPYDWECFKVEEDDCGSDTITNDEYASRTNRPTPNPTNRPSNAPIKINTSKPVQSKDTIAKQKPSSSPSTQQPVIKTMKPTSMPTQQPTQTPSTSNPTKPSADSLVAATILEKVTTSPTDMIGLTPYPVPPSTSHTITNDQKPTLPPTESIVQSTGQEDSIEVESLLIEEEPSGVEVLDPSTSADRPRLYCLSSMNKIDEDCPEALECSVGNACPSGHFCIQHDCKNRPYPHGFKDLCPFRFAGTYSRDCSSYYECDNAGYVGPTYKCQAGHKFDRHIGSCIVESLVDSKCYSTPSQKPTTTTNASVDIISSSPFSNQTNISDDNGTTSVTFNNMTNSTYSASMSPTKSPSDNYWSGNREFDLSQWFSSGGMRGLDPLLIMLLPVHCLIISFTKW